MSPRLVPLCCGKWGTPSNNLPLLRRHAPVAAQSQRWMLLRAVRGEAMSQSSPTRLNAGHKHFVRFSLEAAAVLTATVVLTHAASIGPAIAATEYTVDGLAVATQLNFGSASY